jgi:drug/metabolite transporter (DMT)-like permease
MNPTMGPREWLLLLALALLWGGSFFFAELALMELRPLTVVLGRVGFAALALWAVLALSGRRLPASPRLWCAFLVMGALNNAIPFSLIVWAQVELDSGLAAILNATTPLFTVLLAHLVTAEERLTWNRVAGVLLGLGGVAVLIGPTALTGLGLAGLSQIAVLAAALSYACAGLYGRRFRGLPPSSAAAGMLTASTVLLLPLALLCTALAYLLYFRILASAGATNLLLVTFLIPPGALLLGAMFLGERPEWTAYAGMALIFAGLAAVDGRPLLRLKALTTGRHSAEGAGSP